MDFFYVCNVCMFKNNLSTLLPTTREPEKLERGGPYQLMKRSTYEGGPPFLVVGRWVGSTNFFFPHGALVLVPIAQQECQAVVPRCVSLNTSLWLEPMKAEMVTNLSMRSP